MSKNTRLTFNNTKKTLPEMGIYRNVMYVNIINNKSG